jgi:hypothetical protein
MSKTKIKCIKPEGSTFSRGIRFVANGEYDVEASVAEYLIKTFPKWFVKLTAEPVVKVEEKAPQSKRRKATVEESAKLIEK